MRVRFAIAAALLAALPAAADPARFSSAVEDLPLMDGLTEETSAPFETPEGRIVRVEAEGQVAAAAVADFYRATLPALGWRALDESGELAFARAGERLALRIEERSRRRTRVTFMITPAAAAAAR